jgi:3-methylcrotonyl-CoA carboxylase alpha subunit
VIVYSDADAHTLPVRLADEAIRIGPPPATESYLDQSAILAAARQAHAQAIHPGYGFLAENAEFAQACLDAGLVWVGPPPQAMRALGDKAGAKALAEQHGVPVLPGYHGADQADAALREEAERLGVPLLIKASAGGGGRGMRLVDDLATFESALDAARREAQAAFGDGRVLLERAVGRPRHVEVQILGDRHGHLVYLGERECSVQRRHQKLIEESPSPAVDAALRSRMGEAALRLAAAAGYTGAGTVEFLLDEDGRFAFLEVNARLQVEHPVTELVTGLDLVELQLRVAAGEPLPFDQSDVRLDGHAIEARLIAEDPLGGWTPSSGIITAVRFGNASAGQAGDANYAEGGVGGRAQVRVDTWIEPGVRVSPYYDSLLAKVIAWGPSRTASLARLADSLAATRVDGVRTNLDALLAVVEHPAFVAGALDTAFLDTHAILEHLASPPLAVLAAASALAAGQTAVASGAPRPTTTPGAPSPSIAPTGVLPPSIALPAVLPPATADPWRARSGWRLGRVDQPAVWRHAGHRHTVRLSHDLLGDGLAIASADAGQVVRARPLGPMRVEIDGEVAQVVNADANADTGLRVVIWQGRHYRLEPAGPLDIDEVASGAGSAAAAGQLSAPMPGRVVKVAVAAGETVAQNQPLVVLEAMKMEHVVEAPHAGTVTQVCVQPGQQVTAGTLLVALST